MHLSKQKKWQTLLYASTALSLCMAPAMPLYAFAEEVQQQVSQDTIEFAADQVTFDSETGDIAATGNVQLRKDGYVLLAAKVMYNENTGVAKASGAVELTSPSGDTLFAPEMELSDSLKTALVTDLRLLMADGAQVRAVSGNRNDSEGFMQLDRVVYSPCKVCADGSDTKPLWQIKAVKVLHDKEKRRLIYDDAILEVLGIPVFWTPYFSHPDPTVDKASGFLPLNIQTTKNLGFYVGLPYYWVIDDSKDLTLTPIYTTKEGFVLEAEYRQHIGMGQYHLGGSITRADQRDDFNQLTGKKEFRGHISSAGQFNHSKKWRSTYQVNWASDDTYLRRYDISEADTLVSEYLFEGFLGRSYVSARTLGFQGLRVEDISGKTAFALPLINAEYIPPIKPLGGSISLKGNALALHRSDGLDTQRVSLSANWQRRWITPKGFILDVDALLRSDAYNLDESSSNLSGANNPDDEAFAGTFGTGSTEWRNLARLSATVSWPLVKYGSNGTQTIEPIMEVTLSPRRGTPDDILNEDSRAFELNDLNLFSPDRSAGYDLWEEGSRLTYGLRWRYETDDLTADVLLGQTWRINGSPVVLTDGAGLEGDMSDIVGRTNIRYKDWINFEHRYRLDEKSFAARRNDIDVTFGNDSQSLRLGYLKLDRDLDILNREDREEVRASGFYRINKNWSLNGSFVRRLNGAVIDDIDEGNGNIGYSFGVSFQNECIELGVKYRRSYTEDRDIEPGTSILFRLKLMNLG